MARQAGSLVRFLIPAVVIALVAAAAPGAGASSPAPAPGRPGGPPAASPPPGPSLATPDEPVLERGEWVRLDEPLRVHDTRWFGEPLGPSSIERIDVADLPPVVAAQEASALVLSVTVTGGTQASDLAVWPAGPRPRTSNLNWRQGETVANQVVVPLVGGAFHVGNRSGQVHVIVDVVGYLGGAGAGGVSVPNRYEPVTPTRALDTRAPGAPLDRFGPTGVGTIDLTEVTDVPSDVTGVVVNLTAVGTSAATDLAVDSGPGWSITSPTARTSNLNVGPGQTRAVLAHVPLGPDGLLSIRNQSGTVDVIVDVLGWYRSTGSTVHTTDPVRLFDTRSPTSALTGPFVGGTARTVDSPAIPDGATAAVVNLTVTGGTTAGDLRAWATGTPMPKVSNLNWPAGDTRPNLAIIPLDAQGRFQLRTSAGSTHVIADLVGWTAPPLPLASPVAEDLPFPTGGLLLDVDCTSATFCMAVGDGADRAATWDGTTWTSLTFPPVPPFHGGTRTWAEVDCGTPTACLVVTDLELGEFLEVHAFDGTTFTFVGWAPCCEREHLAFHWGCTASGWCYTTDGDPLDRHGGPPQVHACSDEGFCIGTSDVGGTEPFDQRLKQLVPGPPAVMPTAAALDGSLPLDAWCSSPTACAAVDTAGVATWDGTTWTRAAPSPIADRDSFVPAWQVGWSCVDVDHCLHVVELGDEGPRGPMVVLARDGDTWYELDVDVTSSWVVPSCSPDGTCTVLYPELGRFVQFEFSWMVAA